MKEIFKRWPKEIEDHGIVVALRSKPVNRRNPDAASESLIDSKFVFELGMIVPT